MKTIGILYGGKSGEHEVSLCSAASVVESIDKSKYNIVAIGIAKDGKWYVQEQPEIIEDPDFGKKLSLHKTGTWFVNHFEDNNKLHLYNKDNNLSLSVDVVFPVVHGTYCEDGTLQGLLELAAVPFVGADVVGSSVGMEKDLSKIILKQAGIPVVPWQTINKKEWNANKQAVVDALIENLELPLFVKPCNAGSSVGVKKINLRDECIEKIDFAFNFDNKVLIEKSIDAREIECAVLGNDEPQASVLGEVFPKHEFYSYEAKYIDSDGAELTIPASLEEDVADEIRQKAIEAFRALQCSGMARVDFFIDRKNGNYYFNEINTLPGFTSISMYPKLWQHTGIGYQELLDRLIDLALDRHKEKLKVKTELLNV